MTQMMIVTKLNLKIILFLIKMENKPCDRCDQLENIIINYLNVMEEYKNVLNTLIEKNSIIVKQHNLIQQLRK